MLHDNTHADYLVAMHTFAQEDNNEQDRYWLYGEHTNRYLSQHQVHPDVDLEPNTMYTLDDESAVERVKLTGRFQHYHYRKENYPNLHFGPSPEQKAEWNSESFTMQDYAAIHDMTSELRDALIDAVNRYMPSSCARKDFREVLEHIESAYQRIVYRNGAPLSEWTVWVAEHQSWLESYIEHINDPNVHIQERAMIADISTMLAIAGPLP